MTKENTTTEPTEKVDTTAAQAQSSEVTELTLQDLAALRSIIDVASTRGAFKPTEMVAVGTIYSKLDKFLANVQKGQSPNV